ncbi:MAG TPA: GAF domain-containing SpoIIE family protein phosphatase [Sporichthya sp.]|nr:GAF domain-containing SpoIIE family protein phosphatase [Sporichthya sp.]
MEILSERLERALAAQLRAVHRLTAALHRADSAEAFYDSALDTILTTLEADRASLLLFDPDGVMRFKAWRALSPQYRAAVEGHTPWVATDTDAVPIVVPDVEAEPELSELLPVLRAEGIGALAFVPLVNSDGLVGKFMLYYDRSHAFPEPEVALAEIVAGHVALAIERQRAQDRLRAAAAQAQLAAARLSSLQKVTAELSRAITVADVAAVVLGVALEELGAASGSLCMLDGEQVRLAAAVNYPAEVVESWETVPLEADLPACTAIRTGRIVFLEGTAEERARHNPNYAGRPLAGSEAYAVVPLGTEIAFGALVVGFAEPCHFTEEQAQFLTSLATQCSGALGRADLYEERERARLAAEASRTRLAFLAETSTALGASLDYEATLAKVAELAVPRLADMCTIYLLEDTRVRLVGAAHAKGPQLEQVQRVIEEYPVQLGVGNGGVASVLRTGITVHYRSNAEFLAAATTSEAQRDELRRLDIQAAAIVPITVRGRTIGALALGVESGRTLDDEAVSLAEQLADRAGAAIDISRLFTARTQAARQLQASLLPPQLPEVPGLDLGARYVAGSAGLEVGGDFYDVFPVSADRYLVVLGDVCGRGVEAANTALLIRHVIRSAAASTRSPARVLAHLNDVMLRQALETEDARFATALVAEVDLGAPLPTVTLAIAGHPHPILRSADSGPRSVGVRGTLLGVTGDAEFTDATLALDDGHALVCFTDGATECRNGAEFFGEDGLLRAIEKAGGTASEVAAALEAAVQDFCENTLTDDLAILVLQPGPPADPALR